MKAWQLTLWCRKEKTVGLSERYYLTLAPRQNVTYPCSDLNFAAVRPCSLKAKKKLEPYHRLLGNGLPASRIRQSPIPTSSVIISLISQQLDCAELWGVPWSVIEAIHARIEAAIT